MANLTVNNFNDFDDSVSFADELRRYKSPSELRDSANITDTLTANRDVNDINQAIEYAEELSQLKTPEQVKEGVDQALSFPIITLDQFNYNGTNFSDAIDSAIEYQLLNGGTIHISGSHIASRSLEVKTSNFHFSDAEITADDSGSFTNCRDENLNNFNLDSQSIVCLIDLDDSKSSTFSGSLTLSGANIPNIALLACPKKENANQNCSNTTFDRLTLESAKVGILGQAIGPAFTGCTFGNILTKSIDYDLYIRGNSFDDTFISTPRFGANDRVGATGGSITMLDGCRGITVGSVFIRPQNDGYDRYGVSMDLGSTFTANRIYIEGHFSQPFIMKNETVLSAQDFKVSLTTDCEPDADGDKSVIYSANISGLIDVNLNNRFIGASNIDTFVKFRCAADVDYKRTCLIKAPFDYSAKQIIKFSGNFASNDKVEINSSGKKTFVVYDGSQQFNLSEINYGSIDYHDITINASFSLPITNSQFVDLKNSSGNNRNVVIDQPSIEQLGQRHTIYVDAPQAITFIDGYTAGDLSLGYFRSANGGNLLFQDGEVGVLDLVARFDQAGNYWQQV